MQVIILGSGSPLPDPQRAGPSTLVRTSVGDFLFDCDGVCSCGRRRRALAPEPSGPCS
jgi:ribonuclease BN (tRNA processing enzyme)